MSKSEFLIFPKGTKFAGLGKLGLTPQKSFFFIKIVANRLLKVSENTHVAALLRHLVYHHFRVYDNISRLFSIDFFLKND